MSKHAVELGEELFRFTSKLDWVNHGQDRFASADLWRHEFLCLDALGRPCMYGAHFTRAENDGTYPIVVYRVDEVPA